jgi:hypothetical protein
MTREEALAKVTRQLDEFIEHKLAMHFDAFCYDAKIEEALRCGWGRWRADALAKIDAALDDFMLRDGAALH